MKHIEDKKIKVLVPANLNGGQTKEQEFSYIALINDNCKLPKEGGFTYDLMCKISRIEGSIIKGTKLFESQKTRDKKMGISFEDADFEFIKEVVNKINWAFYAKEFIEFTDYINSIK